MAKISVDYYGTLSKYANFWKDFLRFVVLEGHQVYVLSGNWEIAVFEGLKGLGYKVDVHFTSVNSILRELKNIGFPIWLSEDTDSWYSQPEAWDAAKAHFCAKQNIAIHFDNSINFGKYFDDIPTRFVHTESNKGEAILKEWKIQLDLANTFDDDMFDYYGIGGVVPM